MDEQQPETDPLIGRTVAGRYRIVSALARGGMSRVYRAMQSPLERPVALKVSRADADDPSVERRFRLEAAITSRLTHPNTITVFDYGCDDGLLFYAMEALRGRTLSRALEREGRFAEGRAVHVAQQICGSLREAHKMGAIHRDLKPSNVFLVEHDDDKDFVKVLDFGLVKVFDAVDVSAKLTGNRLSLGTPHYMSPEQARKKCPDHRSDIYSLGVVLFQMLAGCVPFRGASEVDIILSHIQDEVPLLREACPDVEVSEELEAVVRKCLAKSREDRFQSMDKVLVALAGLQAVSAAPIPRPPPPPVDHDASEVSDAEITPVLREGARRAVSGLALISSGAKFKNPLAEID